MTIEIPTWLMWTLGIVFGVPLSIMAVVCLIVGIAVLIYWKPPSW